MLIYLFHAQGFISISALELYSSRIIEKKLSLENQQNNDLHFFLTHA